MDTIIIIKDQNNDYLKLKEILDDGYNIVSCDDIKQLDKKFNVDQAVAIIISLINATKKNVAKYSNYKNKNNIQIPLIVAGVFTGNLLNLLNQGVSEVIVKPYNKSIVRLRVDNAICRAKDNEYRIMADFDPLTKIYNRTAFYREAKKLITHNKDVSYDLACFDIDRFKIINDIYGSSVGDELLIYIANTGIRRMKQHHGLIGRLNGDLFAIVVAHQDNIEEILLQEMNEDINNFNLGINIVISFGYYNIDDLSLPINNMCDRAMMAIKKVKDKYNTSYATYDDELRDQVLEEQRIIDEMDHALENDEFIPYYQPKFNMVTRTYIGFEALMRWISPIRGLIPPSTFIPVFEKNGFISKVDRVIWKKVCQDMDMFRREGRILLPVSVNVSRIELYDLDLGESILSLLKEYNIDIDLFQLEITETAYMQDSSQMIEAVNRLKDLGFTILMDDFGSGFSSLNILKELPFDVIKIDLAFLEHFDINNKAEKILKSVVQMAKRLNMEVIAEGVETRLQEEFLIELGCNRAQGYRFARPANIQEIARMIDSGIIKVGDVKDEDRTIVNIDDLLTTVHQQGEIDWYRQALLELDAQIFEYDFKRDNMIVFDTPIKNNDSNLAKMEIPNYSHNIEAGRLIHPKDIQKYKSFFKGHKEFKITYRRNMINRDSGYVWVKDISRTIFDEDENPKICIGVSRIISDEKLNEQMMLVLSEMEKSTDFDSSINHILSEIGSDFSIDRISLLLKEDNKYRSRYIWQDISIKTKIPDIYQTVKKDVQEMIDYFKNNSIVVVDKNTSNSFSVSTNQNFFKNKAKSIVIIALYDDSGEFIGCMVYTMIKNYHKWRKDELWALQELTKGINVYLNKEKIFDHLDKTITIYNQLLRRLNDGVLMFTYEQSPQILYSNEAYHKIFAIKKITNQNFDSFYNYYIDTNTLSLIHQTIKKCVKTNHEQIIYYSIKTTNNTIINVRTTYFLSPVKENDKRIIISITTKQ